MGDFHEELTPEELAIINGPAEEAAPEAADDTKQGEGDEIQKDTLTDGPGEETSETEQGGEGASESPTEDGTEGNQEGASPVQRRIDKLTWEKNETQRKLDTFKKLGPEGYYKLYPDEAPENYSKEERPPATPKSQPPVQQGDSRPMTFKEASKLVVTGGEYDGMTLAEVMDQDQMAAIDLYQSYRDGVEAHNREVAAKTKAADEERQRSIDRAQREIDAFKDNLSKDLFGKDASTLSKNELEEVDGIFQKVFDFCMDESNAVGNLDVAYAYLNRERQLNKAAQKLAGTLGKTSVPSIGTEANDSVDTGYDAFLNLTANQAAARLDRMTEAQFKDFIKNAPAKVKTRFPNVPW